MTEKCWCMMEFFPDEMFTNRLYCHFPLGGNSISVHFAFTCVHLSKQSDCTDVCTHMHRFCRVCVSIASGNFAESIDVHHQPVYQSTIHSNQLKSDFNSSQKLISSFQSAKCSSIWSKVLEQISKYKIYSDYKLVFQEQAQPAIPIRIWRDTVDQIYKTLTTNGQTYVLVSVHMSTDICTNTSSRRSRCNTLQGCAPTRTSGSARMQQRSGSAREHHRGIYM